MSPKRVCLFRKFVGIIDFLYQIAMDTSGAR